MIPSDSTPCSSGCDLTVRTYGSTTSRNPPFTRLGSAQPQGSLECGRRSFESVRCGLEFRSCLFTVVGMYVHLCGVTYVSFHFFIVWQSYHLLYKITGKSTVVAHGWGDKGPKPIKNVLKLCSPPIKVTYIIWKINTCFCLETLYDTFWLCKRTVSLGWMASKMLR